jgi:DNA-binding beta-propeller fold protein YncE
LRERIHAPELSGATAWLNVDEPPSIRGLRGQLVVLDFWTYCCINCMHVLPVLRDLEERHRNDPLVVIGVHSAKFDAEKDPERILAAMQRYGVSHPVAVDSEMRVWSQYAIRSWPTLVIVRPDGTIAAVAPGEPDPEMLEAFVSEQLAEARAAGTLATAPARLLQDRQTADSPLLFPGKVAAARDGRIAVSDSGHHRVLLLDADGVVQDAVGTGLRGRREGPFSEAALDDPQGLAFDGEALYVADARAHVVWRADLRERRVLRIAGTFELGRTPLLAPGRALGTPLRSPWDLAIRGGELYVALAGSHQIARMDLREGTIEPVAGNGREALIDGPGAEAALAQPSGLSLSGDTLYVADSESSGVRAFDLASRRIGSLVGGPGLFDFGDATGPIRPGMLQHPLAVAATPEGLLVADTYNGKIKRFSRDGRVLETFFAGAAGLRLSEPSGLAVLPSGDVLVADTNHHRLVRLSHDARVAAELPVRGAPAPLQGVAVEPGAPERPGAESGAGWFTAFIPASRDRGFRAGAGKLVLELLAPEGFELAEGAPWQLSLEVSRRSDLLQLASESLRGHGAGGPRERVEVPVVARHEADVDSELIVHLRTVACSARDHAACYPVRSSFRVPLHLLRDGQREVSVPLPLEVRR